METDIVNVRLDTSSLDELTEKAERLKILLQEVKELLRSMNTQ